VNIKTRVHSAQTYIHYPSTENKFGNGCNEDDNNNTNQPDSIASINHKILKMPD